MPEDEGKNAVDDVETETVDEESSEQGNREAAEHHHGEGFDSGDLARKGKESKENPPDPE